MTRGDNKVLRIGDESNWHFVNGRWQDREDNLLTVPKELHRSDGYSIQGHHYAFHKGLCYKDVHGHFDFRLTPHSDIGIILRATSESRFYLLHFPNCAQASRAQHFWVAFSKMDETGYLRRIKMEMVRRVPSNKGLWLSADLILSGNKISVRIGGVGLFEAEDGTYSGPGHIGLYSHGYADIRNLTVEGEPVTGLIWNEKERQPANWFHPCPDTEYGPWQLPFDLIRFPNRDLLLSYVGQEQRTDVKGTPLLSRSYDNGRSWSKPEILQASKVHIALEPPRLHLTPGGRLLCLIQQEDGFMMAESKDKAGTWSQPVPVKIGPVPPKIKKLVTGPQAFLNLSDGSIVLFCCDGYSSLSDPDLTNFTWGALHCQAFACRSTDDGRTWSAPVNVDNPGCDAKGKQYEGNLDLSEVCGAQMGDGRIMALIRPKYSPWMWETWSRDGGKSWGPCARGPFPGYATPNMLRTTSGAILVAHRLPSVTIHCSLDDGQTWDEGTLIDGSMWCMGSMIEAEPDVILYVYWDSFESLMRAQFIKVTKTGLMPLRYKR